jgi:hypothetical protein
LKKLTILALATLILFSACEENIVGVNSYDGIATIHTKEGNAEAVFISKDWGKSVVVTSANDHTIGVKITRKNHPGTVIFHDGYIKPGQSSSSSSVNFEFGWKIKVEVIVYNSIGETFVNIIKSFGPDFIDKITKSWGEGPYVGYFTITPS